MKIQVVFILILIFLISPIQAAAYEVLVVDIAAADNHSKFKEFKKDAARLNALHRKGYSSAKPYFNVLRMADGRVYFVFGFKDRVQGIHRENYPATIKNLRRLKKGGTRKYPDMHWLPVGEIRRLMGSP
jgi:hypothetical protein